MHVHAEFYRNGPNDFNTFFWALLQLFAPIKRFVLAQALF